MSGYNLGGIFPGVRFKHRTTAEAEKVFTAEQWQFLLDNPGKLVFWHEADVDRAQQAAEDVRRAVEDDE